MAVGAVGAVDGAVDRLRPIASDRLLATDCLCPPRPLPATDAGSAECACARAAHAGREELLLVSCILCGNSASSKQRFDSALQLTSPPGGFQTDGEPEISGRPLGTICTARAKTLLGGLRAGLRAPQGGRLSQHSAPLGLQGEGRVDRVEVRSRWASGGQCAI